MRRILLSVVIFFISITASAQLEVKENSFKEVPGFVNINPDDNYQTDDNDLPFAVIKVRTENINDKQRRELKFGGNAGTFIVLEYKDGEVWVYLTAKYADYLKISHPDLSSIEFTLPFDLEPKKGYEMTLVNKPAVDEEIQKKLERLEELEKYSTVAKKQPIDTCITKLLKGKFSVSRNKRVYFSQGNLQYQASTDTWRFANNQWDTTGYTKAWSSSDYAGWMSCFAWGTGDDPTKIGPPNSDYPFFNDWGNNVICNGGDKKWYTLTIKEWDYVLNKRKTQSGARFAKAIVNGINGVIILPDDWDISNYNLNNINVSDASFRNNKISNIDWCNKLENAGAVFLPVTQSTGIGWYWSSTVYDQFKANVLNFHSDRLGVSGVGEFKGITHGVRLVSDVE